MRLICPLSLNLSRKNELGATINPNNKGAGSKGCVYRYSALVYLWKFKREYCNNCILVQRVLGVACSI